MIPAISPSSLEGRAPGRAAARPHVVVAAVAFCTVASCLVAACANNDQNQVGDPIVLGMTDQAPTYYSDQELTLYEVQTPVPLPVRKPTDAEKSALDGQSQAPYPRAPFLLASDEQIEVHFTISNLDDQQHNVELLLDPWNEFRRYEPGVTVVSDEETVPNTSGYDKYFVVPGKSRVEGTITHDDTNELAIDFATAMAILANPPDPNGAFSATTLLNHAFDLQNRSNDGDPLVTPYVPKIIAGLTGFDLGLRTTEPANVAVEIVVDFSDLNGNRALPVGSTDKPLGRPGAVLSPPGARQGN